jgi:DNA-binding Xre family transcriptional regulator
VKYLVKKLALCLALFIPSAFSSASLPTDTYEDLQNLKSNVRAAYVNALIVDKDSRAHAKRVAFINKIDATLDKIENLTELSQKHRKELSRSLSIYLRSAKNEANTYDINLGSRTFSNGYSAYSELIEHIYAPIQTIEVSENIPKKSIQIYALLDHIAEAVEIHGERIIKTKRVAKLTQTNLDAMCATIESGLEDIAKYPDSKSVINKASLKWGFIKAPICNLDQTSAPYTITHYGFLLTDILRKYATDQLGNLVTS